MSHFVFSADARLPAARIISRAHVPTSQMLWTYPDRIRDLAKHIPDLTGDRRFPSQTRSNAENFQKARPSKRDPGSPTPRSEVSSVVEAKNVVSQIPEW